MKIISIANQKGGKTTSSINLAATLGLNGKRTLLIDLDPQAHATLGLNMDIKTAFITSFQNLLRVNSRLKTSRRSTQILILYRRTFLSVLLNRNWRMKSGVN